MVLSNKVLQVLKEERISAEELQLMVDRCAITREGGCNGRYFQWLFLIEGQSLVNMRRAELMQVGEGEQTMEEEHETCVGQGCRQCGWAGVVLRRFSDSTAAFVKNP